MSKIQGGVERALKLAQNIPHAIASKFCNWCHQDITHFDDQEIADEYHKSALCQDCQNEVFGRTN